MPHSTREIPKEIAAFGERQFKETGALAVEVLRVKSAVMRKYFSKLRGITFLVAVISLDRVRIYFFNAAGIMLVGENVEPNRYGKIRRASKLIAKFEKPKELTPEELRIEATQELRDSLTKEIRRVSRFLATSEPSFPNIFIIKETEDSSIHRFGMQISEDGEFLFEEPALTEKFSEGIISRSAFMTLLDSRTFTSEIPWIVGNGIALAVLKDADHRALLKKWRRMSKDSEALPLVNHIVRHVECYSHQGFIRILSLLRSAPDAFLNDAWKEALSVIHASVQVPIGTEEYHIIQGFCRSLEKPRKLESRRHVLESIHLAPRVICDPTPLDIHLSANIDVESEDAWVEVNYLDGTRSSSFSISESVNSNVNSIEYWLNLEDTYPTSGGLIPHGKDIIRRALSKLGLLTDTDGTFQKRIDFGERQLNANERAVLVRLASGQLEVLSNTLVGSPQVVENLLKTGTIALIPGFNHLGINPDFLVRGKEDQVLEVSKSSCLEATIFGTSTESFAVVSAPNGWKAGFLELASMHGLGVWPILSSDSSRNILRDEQPFPRGNYVMTWSEGPI
ncbi:MAG: hypothetical protein ACFFCP_13230 [Promethearchaeota archaeon]